MFMCHQWSICFIAQIMLQAMAGERQLKDGPTGRCCWVWPFGVPCGLLRLTCQPMTTSATTWDASQSVQRPLLQLCLSSKHQMPFLRQAFDLLLHSYVTLVSKRFAEVFQYCHVSAADACCFLARFWYLTGVLFSIILSDACQCCHMFQCHWEAGKKQYIPEHQHLLPGGKPKL